MRLAGHHALITGGASGIGRSIAIALGIEGAKISIVGRRPEAMKETSAALRIMGIEQVRYTTTDVTDLNRVRSAFSALRQSHGRITILVNSAGAAESGPFGKVTEDSWRRMMAVNLDGAFHCCQAALPDLLQFGQDRGQSRIVNIASTAGLRGYKYTAPYVAAKHGLVGLTRALAEEFAGKGLTANAICPGFTDTELVSGAAQKIHEATGRRLDRVIADIAAMNPSGRLIAPQEVADRVLDLILSGRNGEAVEIA